MNKLNQGEHMLDAVSQNLCSFFFKNSFWKCFKFFNEFFADFSCHQKKNRHVKFVFISLAIG